MSMCVCGHLRSDHLGKSEYGRCHVAVAYFVFGPKLCDCGGFVEDKKECA
ncbi:Uncharacterised protein [Mycobacteroides abscessus subsp. abscessus]|nr:Uncharacterised protein [Mycobacteroides abscessus subsp. abscessus]